MGGGEHLLRLAGVLTAAALLGWTVARPTAGADAVARIADLAPERAAMADATCPSTRPILAGPFAPPDDILSISPLGGVTAPGEPLPAPYIRLATRKGETVFDRKVTSALAPARADIVLIERRLETGRGGVEESWRVDLTICDGVRVTYDRLNSLDPSLLRRAGGLGAFAEIGGPTRTALQTRIRVDAGSAIGLGDGFDVALYDDNAPPAAFARPERYHADAYARAAALDAPAELLEALSPSPTTAKCPLDYLPPGERAGWSAKLGDAFGFRKPAGADACRTAARDIPGSAQGVWFTDSSHNAATSKVSAAALAPDTIDPERLIFALHGRVKSLTPDLIGLAPPLEEQRRAATQDFLTVQKESGRINPAFADIRDNGVYCYEGLRVNFVGPRVAGVLLLSTGVAENGASIMSIEVRGDVHRCIDLPEPWSFTGAETTFYR